jgi:organic radical activating enzyme
MDESETAKGPRPERDLLRRVLRGEGELGARLARLRAFSKGVRTSEYHVTSACNLRCQGCWFFEYDYDKKSTDLGSIEAWRMFVKEQAQERRITSALLIGGEPSLYPDRVAVFVEHMPYVTISSNGLRKLPREGFEKVQVALTLFGGEGQDDTLRAIRPSGRRFTGLFDQVLRNYTGDDRVTFVFAVAPDHPEAIEPTIRRIRDNGNLVTFNYYTAYGSEDPLRQSGEEALLEELIRVRELYPEVVVNTPYSIRTLVTGRSHWADFGYGVCPSISADHPAHAERLANGNPTLPGFNSWASDGKTLNFCCTSAHCDGCRDSQAVYSWLLVSMKHFLGSAESLAEWLDTAESYWRQFRWSPYHRSQADAGPPCPSM